MSAAVDIATIALVLIAGFAYLIGLGYPIYRIFIKRPATGADGLSVAGSLPPIVALGLVANYAINLVFQSMGAAGIAGAILSVLGLAFLLFELSRSKGRTITLGMPVGALVGAVLLSVAYLGPLLFQGLSEWDPRSIWFFHSKMIFFSGTLGYDAGWTSPGIQFSHTDYPLFMPSLSAQIASSLGYWNEYVPKLSFVFLLVPAMIRVFSYITRGTVSFVALLLGLTLANQAWMWNGYMDAWLGLYFALALLSMHDFLKTGAKEQLLSLLAFAGIALYLKNEGALVLLSCGLAFVAAALFLRTADRPRLGRGATLRAFAAGAFIALPFLLWELYKQLWGLHNDLQIGTAGSLTRAFARLTDGSILVILQDVYARLQVPLLVLGGLALFIHFKARKSVRPVEIVPALAATGLYLAGIIAVYLITPADLTWHLDTSVDRVMLVTNAGVYVLIWRLMVAIEGRDLSLAPQGTEGAR